MSLLLLLRNHEDGAATEPPPVSSGGRLLTPVRPVGRTVRLKMVADLGSIVAALDTRIQFGDEEDLAGLV